MAALDFSGGAGMSSPGFTNTADVSVAMVVVVKNTLDNYGSFFHHGDRNNDLSLERNGSNAELVFQTNSDIANCKLSYTLNTPTILFGRMTAGTSRYFSMTTSSGTTSTSCTNTLSLTSGSKVFFLGKSSNLESSNSYIGEVAYYSTALSDADRDSIIAYLKSKWGI